MNTNAPAPGWWCKAIEWGAACVVFAVGGLGVAGWMGWWTGAHAIVPRGSALAANAAVVFILLAGAIPSAHARYGRALAGVLVFLGVSALWRHLSGAVLPWDPLPWPGIAALPSGESGAMSATAGYNCLLLAVALWLRPQRPDHPLVALAAGALFAFCVLSLIGWVELAGSPGRTARIELMSPLAMVGFGAAGLGLLPGIRVRLSAEQRQRSLALASLSISLVLVCGVSFGAWISNTLQSRANERVIASYEIVESANYVELCVTRMESAARGYALAREAEAFRLFDENRQKLDGELLRLKRLVSADEEQRARFVALNELIQRQRDVMVGAMAVIRAGQRESTPENFLDLPGPDPMAELQEIVNSIDRAERVRLAEAISRFEAEANTTGEVILLAAALALIFAALAWLIVRQAEEIRTRAEQQLRVANDTLDRRVRERTAELQDAVTRLAQAEAYYRQVTESLPQLVWTCAPDGRCEWLGPQWVEYTGLPEQPQLGFGWAEQIHADDREATLRAWHDASSSGKPFDVEFRIRRHDGEYRWFKTRATPLRDPSGAIVRWFGANTDIHGQKAAAAELEQRVRERTAELASVNLLQRAMLDGTVFSIISTRPDGVIETFNRGAEKMLGYASEEVVGRATPALFHDPAEVAARAAALSHELGRPVAPGFQVFVARVQPNHADEQRWTYVHKDGSRLPVWLSVTVLRNETGDVTGYLGIAHDLTERERAEELWRESRERMSTIFAATDEGLVLQGANGEVLECNDSACRILGLTRERLTGRDSLDPRWESIHEDGTPFPGPTHPAPVALRTGEAQHNVVQGIRKPDGSVVWIRTSSVPIPAPDGTARLVVSSFTDITAQRASELKLREALAEAQRFRDAQDNLLSFVYMKDTQSRYVYANRPTLKLFGCTAEELVGSDDYRFFSRETAERLRTVDRRVFAGETTTEEIATTDAGGRAVYYWEVKTPIYVDAQRTVPWGLLGVSTDITERKQLLDSLARARDEALEASRLKSAFLANMSHEIRTPMNGVIGMSDLLLETPMPPAQRQMVEVMHRSAESLLTIVNDILDFSKIEAGKLRIEASEFDLRQLVEETVALLAPRAEMKALRVSCVFEADFPAVVCGDAVRIRQVLTNLVGNAVKFTDAGDVAVAVRLRREMGDRAVVHVEVRDTGPGIAPDQQARLFEAFVQADDTSTRRHGGAGLGLAISRQLVQLMGGEIGVQSEPGRGACFWFDLPLTLPGARVASPAAPAAARAPVAIPGGLNHFLVVEDNPTNQIVAQSVLEQLGHTCVVVDSGAAALEALASAKFDAVLLDCQMPDMDGYEVARRIRAGVVPAAQDIVIVALTAYAMAEDRARCLAAGMDDYVSKPLRAADLRTALERVAARVSQTAASAADDPSSDVRDGRQETELRAMTGRKGGPLWFELIDLFLEETPALLRRIDELRARRASAELVLVAHRAAGSSAMLGAVAFRLAALAIEAAARAGRWEELDLLLPRLEKEWERLRAALLATRP